MKTPPLLVFVHGFLGESSKTFQEFPGDLRAALQREFRFSTESVLYNYECQGTDQVHRLLDFLLDKVAEAPSRPLVLLAHSMGGILSLDVLREASLKMDLALPVKGVLAFDTPFFGLHPNVLLDSGLKRVCTATSSFVDIVSAVLPLYGAAAVTKTSSSRSSYGQSAQRTEERRGSGASLMYRMHRNLWMGLAAGVAAAAVTYQSLDADSKEKVKQVTRSHTDKLSGHLDFLGPLWRDVGDMGLRFRELSQIIAKQRLTFHCFYTKIHPTDVTFISAPPSEFSSLFSPIPYSASRVSDEIDAHSHMFFKRQEPDAYDRLLSESVSWIHRIFLEHSNK